MGTVYLLLSDCLCDRHKSVPTDLSFELEPDSLIESCPESCPGSSSDMVNSTGLVKGVSSSVSLARDKSDKPMVEIAVDDCGNVLGRVRASEVLSASGFVSEVVSDMTRASYVDVGDISQELESGSMPRSASQRFSISSSRAR